MIKEKLNIDEKDIKIIDMLMKDPSISQSVIAEQLKLSQPSVNLRIQKLKNKGILSYNIGIDFSKSNLFLTRVDFTATDANAVLNRLNNCTFFVNGFIMAGKNNVSVFFANEDLRKIEDIINNHLRNDPQISDINVNIIVSTAKEYLIQMDLNRELNKTDCTSLEKCKNCKDLTSKKVLN